jgi:predicted glycoside hydrolase/deacetylase ChbG (UPF0249 family)
VANQKISSLSTIINGKNIPQAVKYIQTLKQQHREIYNNLSIGLHFNLTEGHPASYQIKDSKLV